MSSQFEAEVEAILERHAAELLAIIHLHPQEIECVGAMSLAMAVSLADTVCHIAPEVYLAAFREGAS